MHSSSSLSDSESLTGSEMETAGQLRRQTAGKCLFCAQHTQSHMPVSESCRRDCQRSLMSPEAARADRSHGFCCGPARACVGRSGRLPVAHGQGLPCPCSGPYWLQLASAGRRLCGAPRVTQSTVPAAVGAGHPSRSSTGSRGSCPKSKN